MPIAIQKEIEKLERNGKLTAGAVKQYLQKGPQYIIPEIQEIYTFWNRELPGGPITFYADEIKEWVEIKFYQDYKTLNQDEIGTEYTLKIEIQKEERAYHIQTTSEKIEMVDEIVSMETLKKYVQDLAQKASVLFREESDDGYLR